MEHFRLLCYFFAIFSTIVANVHGVIFPSNPEIKGFSLNIIHAPSKLSRSYQQPAMYSTNKYQSVIHPDGQGDNVMELYIGTPPVKMYASADTGSEIAWFQCAPCLLKCYPQDVPMFNPYQSSTYAHIPCYEPDCRQQYNHGCAISSTPGLPPDCIYNITYGDGDYSAGFLSRETISMSVGMLADGAEVLVQYPNFRFGCGFDNVGNTYDKNSAGTIGLNMGPLSLVSQLGIQKFSYCLPPPIPDSYGRITFGEDVYTYGSETEARNVVRTPLITRPNSNFYYVNLEGATVAGKRIHNQVNSTYAGDMLIDSGTTLTSLETGFYNNLEAAVKNVIGLTPANETISNETISFHQLCYHEFPEEIEVVFHFNKWADVTLKPLNLFHKSSREATKDQYCFAMVPEYLMGGQIIYGYRAQTNFHVTYDLENKLVSFAPSSSNCGQI